MSLALFVGYGVIVLSNKHYMKNSTESYNTVIFEHSNNSVFRHVRDANHATIWKNNKMVFSSDVPNQRVVVESVFIKKLQNCDSTQSTLAINNISSQLILHDGSGRGSFCCI